MEPREFAGRTGAFQRGLEVALRQIPLPEALVDAAELVLDVGQAAPVGQRGRRFVARERLAVLAQERAEAALALCVALGDRHREAALHNNLADLLHAAGRREESMTHLKRAVEIFAEVGEEGELQPEIWKLVEW